MLGQDTTEVKKIDSVKVALQDVISHNKIYGEWRGYKSVVFLQDIEIQGKNREIEFYKQGLNYCIAANDTLIETTIPALETALGKYIRLYNEERKEVKRQKFKVIVVAVVSSVSAGLLGYFAGRYIPLK